MVKYATYMYMKMFRIDDRIRKSLMEFPNWRQNSILRQNAKMARQDITKVIISSSIIEIETRLFLQTICFRYHRMQWNKRYIYLTSLSCKIQNCRYEITKGIISSLIIEIETALFFQTICFRYQGMQSNKWYIYSTSLSCKFKMAAMKSLKWSCICMLKCSEG